MKVINIWGLDARKKLALKTKAIENQLLQVRIHHYGKKLMKRTKWCISEPFKHVIGVYMAMYAIIIIIIIEHFLHHAIMRSSRYDYSFIQGFLKNGSDIRGRLAQ